MHEDESSAARDCIFWASTAHAGPVSARVARVVSQNPAAILRPVSPLRRGGRVAEGARLESVYTGNRIVGSNPTPSARHPVRRYSPATAIVHISDCFIGEFRL